MIALIRRYFRLLDRLLLGLGEQPPSSMLMLKAMLVAMLVMACPAISALAVLKVLAALGVSGVGYEIARYPLSVLVVAHALAASLAILRILRAGLRSYEEGGRRAKFIRKEEP